MTFFSRSARICFFKSVNRRLICFDAGMSHRAAATPSARLRTGAGDRRGGRLGRGGAARPVPAASTGPLRPGAAGLAPAAGGAARQRRGRQPRQGFLPCESPVESLVRAAPEAFPRAHCLDPRWRTVLTGGGAPHTAAYRQRQRGRTPPRTVPGTPPRTVRATSEPGGVRVSCSLAKPAPHTPPALCQGSLRPAGALPVPAAGAGSARSPAPRQRVTEAQAPPRLLSSRSQGNTWISVTCRQCCR